MKRISYILSILIFSSLMMSSCDGFLNVDSERYTYEEDYRLSSKHDSLYSMVGILSQLQLLGDRYVLLGELRGDLMYATDNASRFLKEINDFSISNDNPYNSTKEYYAVINNCNYTIQYVDTALAVKGTKPMYKVMAAAKAIRAWTYLQLVLNYGTCKYIVDPILTAEDAEKDYPSYNVNELAEVLVQDLLPYADIDYLDLGNFASVDSKKALIPVKMILGDLYLWKGDYQNAAAAYYSLIYDESRLINPQYNGTRAFLNDVPTGSLSSSWINVFSVNCIETISFLVSSPDYGHAFTLDTLSLHFDIAGTKKVVNDWQNALYYENNNAITKGDMRIYGSLTMNTYFSTLNESLLKGDSTTVDKYLFFGNETEKSIIIYRNSLLYLRYAEAVNRMGFPNLAFAVLKSGLKPTTVRTGKVAAELTNAFGTAAAIPAYMTFTDFRFTTNTGTRMRGLGKLDLDSTYYIIQNLPTKEDSILYVEDKIVEELEAELAFEGNRFQDLVRVATRRNDPAYLADKVSQKYKNTDLMKAKLMDTRNWFLPGK